MTETTHRFTRRAMLATSGMAGLAALTGITPKLDAQAPAAPGRRPRLACLVSYWGLPTSHADWILSKVMDGYWWHGAHTPSGVDVVSAYLNQYATRVLG